MENVNFTIFLEGLWFPCWLQSASSRRQGLWIWLFRGHLAVSRVTRNRHLSDALTLGGPYGTIWVFRLC